MYRLMGGLDAGGDVEFGENVVGTNGELGVTWVRSFVSDDKGKSFCIYHAPTPEAVRQAAERNGLPVDRIIRIQVLDPYFYH